MNYIFMPFIIFFIFIIYMSYNEYSKPANHPILKVGHGSASKISFEGHSYVIWQQNISDCIIHDPDCECKIKQE